MTFFDIVDFNGLSHFYNKIKTKFASKAELDNKMDKLNPTGTGNAEFSGDVIAYGCGGTTPISLNELNSRPVNNNILINSNFANPVNQRDFTELTVSAVHYEYTVDRWIISRYSGAAATTLKLGDGCVVLSGDKRGDGFATFGQFVEYVTKGTYTLSAKINGKIYSHTFEYNEEEGFETGIELENDSIGIGVNSDIHWETGELHLFVWISIQSKNLSSANIEWAKLEAGSVATPYVPRLYGEELELCKRYYQKFAIPLALVTDFSANAYIPTFHKVSVDMRTTPSTKFQQIMNSSFGNAGGNVSYVHYEQGAITSIMYSKALSKGNYGLLLALDADL